MTSGSHATPRTRVDTPDKRKLSSTQRAYLAGRADGQAYGGVDCLVMFEFCSEEIDVDALRSAARALRRHPVLRSTMNYGYHRCDSQGDSPFTFGVSEHAGSDRELEDFLADQRREILTRHADYAAGELAWIDLVRWRSDDGGSRRDIATITISLAVADLAGISVIVDELAENYLAVLATGQLPEAVQVRTFSDIEERERVFAGRKASKSGLAGAKPAPEALPPAPQIPLRSEPQHTVTRRTATLSAQQWDALGALSRRANSTRSALSLAIYRHALSLWAGDDPFTVVVPGMYYRPTAGEVLDRTQTWAVRLPSARGTTLGEASRAATAELRYRIERGIDSSEELSHALRAEDGHPGTLPFVITPAAERQLFTQAVTRAFGTLNYSGFITPQVLVDLQILRFFDGEVSICLDVRDGAFTQAFGDELFDTIVEAHRRIADAELAGHEPEHMGIAEAVCLSERTLARRDRLNTTPRHNPRTLHERFVQRVRTAPGATAVVDSASGDLTYAELYDAALRLAESYQDAVGQGDLVAVRLPKGRDQVVAVLAVLFLGASYLPVSVDAPKERVEAIFDTARPAAVIDALPREIYQPPRAAAPGFKPSAVRSDAPAYVIFTSGSTGVPKGVVMTHEAASNTIDAVCEHSGLGPDDKVLAVSALDFDLSVFDIFGMLGVGGTVVTLGEDQRRDAFAWAEMVARHGVTVWNSAPALAEMLCVAADGREGLPLRSVFVSGDWVPLTLPGKVFTVSPQARLVSMGGATEGGIWSNEYVVARPADVPQEWTSIPYGVPLDGQAYRVVNEWGEDCPTGVVGELWIGGASLARGYLGREELTAEKFVEAGHNPPRRWYRTGDYGYWHLARERDDASDLLFFVGRQDNQVKIRGHRVELGDVEHHIVEDAEVAAAVVVPNPEKTALYALVVPEDGAAGAGEGFGARVRERLVSRLPEFMIPRDIVAVNEFALTANGKVDRKWAAQVALDSSQKKAALPAPTAGVAIARAWAGVLEGVDAGEVRADSHFFALGGDSISATAVCAALREQGFDVKITDLFENPTFDRFAAVCGLPHRVQESPVGGGHAEEGQPFPLTPLQRAYAMGNDGISGTVQAHTVFSAVVETNAPGGFQKPFVDAVIRVLLAGLAPLRVMRESGAVLQQRVVPLDEIGSDTGLQSQLLGAGETLREVLSTRVPQHPLELVLPHDGAAELGVVVDYLALDGRSLSAVMDALCELLGSDPGAQLRLPSWIDGSADAFAGYCVSCAAREEGERATLPEAAQPQRAEPPRLPVGSISDSAREFTSLRGQVPLAELERRAARESAACGIEVTASAVVLAEYGAALARLAGQPAVGIVVPLAYRPDENADSEVLGAFSQLGLCECSAEPDPAAVQRSLIGQLGTPISLGAVSGTRSARYPAAFTSMLGYDARRRRPGAPNGGQARVTWAQTRTPGVLIDCQVSHSAKHPEGEPSVEIRWDIPRGVFDSGTIHEAFTGMVSALGGAAEAAPLSPANDPQGTAAGLLARVLEMLDIVAPVPPALTTWARPVVEQWKGGRLRLPDAPVTWQEADARYLADVVTGHARRFSLLEHPRLSPRALLAQDPAVTRAADVLRDRLEDRRARGRGARVVELGFGLPPSGEPCASWTVIEPDALLADIATVEGRSCLSTARELDPGYEADVVVVWGNFHRDPRVAQELAGLPLADDAELHLAEPVAATQASLVSAALLNPGELWRRGEVEDWLGGAGWTPSYLDAEGEAAVVIRATRGERAPREVQPSPEATAPDDLSRTLSRCWVDHLPQLGPKALSDNGHLDPTANFFEAGGDSLGATRVIAAAHDMGLTGLNVVDLFNYPTFGNFLDHARCLQPEGTTRQAQRWPLTRVQRAYVAGQDREQLLGGLPARCAFEYQCEGLDVDRLEAAVNAVVDAHPALRAVVCGPAQAETRDRAMLLPAFRRSQSPASDLAAHVPDHEREGALVVWASTSSVAVSMNNLFIDGASMFRLIHQLSWLYEDPSRELGAPAATQRDYLEAHPGLVADTPAELLPALDAQLDQLPPAALRPDAAALHELEHPRMHRVSARVSGEVWRCAQEEYAAWQVTPAAGVLASFARALAQYASMPELTINLTLFDRDPQYPGIDEVIGDFTSLSLLPLRGVTDGDAERVAREAQEELLRAHAPERDALRLAARAVTRSGDPAAGLFPVVFTCGLGLNRGGEQDFSLSETSFGTQVAASSTTPQVVLDLQVVDDAEGVSLTADCLVQALDPEDAQEILDATARYIDATAQGRGEQDLGAQDREAAEIWSDVLGLSEVGAETNFFRAGGDSLKATTVISRLRAAGRDVSLRTLLTNPDFGQFCAAISGGEAEADTEVAADDWFELTDVQASYLVGRTDAYAEGGVGCQGYAEFEVDTSLLGSEQRRDLPAALSQAWDRVAARHDMVHAVIDREGRQRIDRAVEVPLRVVALPDNEAAARGVRAEIREELRSKNYAVGTAPMMDIVLSVGCGDPVLHLSVDLMITDYVGIRALIADLDWCLANPAGELPAPSTSFREWVERKEEYRRSPEGRALVEADKVWWAEKLQTAPAALAFSRDDGPQAPGGGTTRRSFDLAPQRWRGLCSVAKEQGVTPSALVLGAFATVARRYGELGPGQESALMTLTTVDRGSSGGDLRRTVGDFTSTVVLDLPLERDPLVAARGVHDRLFDALDHPNYSGVRVVRDLRRQREAGRGQIPVVFTSTVGVEAEEPPRALREVPGSALSKTPQVLLDVQLMPMGEGVSVDWDCRDGGFHPAVIDACFADFTSLLEQLADARPPRLPERRPEPVQRGAQVTHRDLPSAFLSAAVEDPEALALIDGGVPISRGELVGRAWAISQALSDGQGPVVIDCPPGLDQVAAQYAALLARRAFVPVDTEWSKERKDSVRRSLAKAYGSVETVTPADLAQCASSERAGDWRGGITDALAQWRAHPERLDEVAYIIFTSGSTGAPKGVAVTHRQVSVTLEDVGKRLRLTPQDRVLAVSRPSFDLAIFNAFGVLGAGGAMVIPACGTTPDPETWVRELRRHEVTLWNSVPAQLSIALDFLDDAPGEGALALRAALVSGDLVPTDQPLRLRRHAPHARFIALGGATEGSIWSIAHECTGDAEEVSGGPIPYGRALNGQGVWVLNRDGERAAVGQRGEIVIAGDAVANGYVGTDRAAEAAFGVHQPTGERTYRTGDLGAYLPDGEIAFCGRLNDAQVKIRGHRIEFGDVEAGLRAVPGVTDALAAVVGEGSGKELVAAVSVSRSGDPSLRERVLRAHEECRTRPEELRELYALMTQASRQAMWSTLREAPGTTPRTIAGALGAIGREQLLTRWLRELCASGYATCAGGVDAIGPDTHVRVHTCDELAVDVVEPSQLWRRAFDLDRECGFGTTQLRYLKDCLDKLTELLDGRVDPLSLLFPEGDASVVQASYGDNPVAGYLNRVCAAAVDSAAERCNGAGAPCRILEIGAGVGATTQPVLDELEANGRDYSYVFSDVSRYFTDAAASRWPQLSTRIVDVNRSLQEQEIAAGSVDVVVCANALHNAHNVDEALREIDGVLAPGGLAVIIDSTAPNAPLMASMEFKEGLRGATDARRETTSPFLDYDQWARAIGASPLDLVSAMPPAGSVWEVGSQHVFVARKEAPGGAVNEASISEHAGAILPAYMVPRRLAVVAAMPMTSNGKRDRSQVAALVDAPARPTVQRERGKEDGPDPVVDAWRDVLGLGPDAAVDDDADFFDLGGDSLLLARCIGQMRRAVGEQGLASWDETLRAIVAEPTVAGCRRALDLSPQPVAQPRGGAQAPRGDDAAETLVVIPDAKGWPGGDESLLTALRRGRSDVVAVEAPAADAEASDLIARYSEDLLPRVGGRVHVVGYGLGGVIAAGVGDRLAACGCDARVTAISSGPVAEEQPVTVPVTLLRPADTLPLSPERGQEMTAFWREHCLGPLTVDEVPGDPETCVRGAGADVIAEIVLEQEGARA